MLYIPFSSYIPKKSLGQNFLQDTKIINKIIHFIKPNHDHLLVEIGPGLAALTHLICNYVDYLVVIEIDKKLSDFLKKYSFSCKVLIYERNVLFFDFKKLFFQENQLLRVFGNIPYNISVQLIFHLIKFRHFIFDINFMVQKEVADRLMALPGNKCYGRLSIIAQCYYNIYFGFDISPNSFFPKPKVYSSFIKMIPKLNPLLPFNKMNILQYITSFAFKKRRKMIRNSLKGIFDENTLFLLNINPDLRAEDLSVQEYCKLSDFYFSKLHNLNPKFYKFIDNS
ncbi:16S rRNA (adenine(1518)-N(6)/adenine(1519)-N(6))-dimethyltransferase RsmA [Buchnera aphidicola]|uniref:16S rRNA (adenine(1518)-N(6)/adenine(1519)-N(6))- dimethyltransferase RsmA n=1 Tax=Buchnera aphidicola TaxID=9 RepID=UPI0031B841BD